MIPKLPSADVLEDRRRSARATMALHEIDSMLVSDEANVRYLTGFTGDSTILFLEADRATMISDGRYQTQLRDECGTLATFIRPPTMPMPLAIAELLSTAPGTIGIESAHMTVSTFEAVNKSIRSPASEPPTLLKPIDGFLVA
ncbi:MAG: aminopeptidase P family N-terminal domain-containing protein, partial [Planctomycetota bacterium]